MFREMAGLKNSPRWDALDDAALCREPLRSFDLDSLSAMEFIMAVENEFGVTLDEDAVNRCDTVGEIAGLVAQELDA